MRAVATSTTRRAPSRGIIAWLMIRIRVRDRIWVLPLALGAVLACSSGSADLASPPTLGTLQGGSGGTGRGTGGDAAAAAVGGSDSGAGGSGGTGVGGTTPIDVTDPSPPPECEPVTCAGLGWECGYIVDECGNKVDCADEGLTCGPLEACTGGVGAPTVCQSALGEGCTLCGDVPDCSAAPQLTMLTGRVITPGRNDADAANQLGVPNAFVYILRSNDVTTLPAITAGIPTDGTSCDCCGEQDLGPVLVGGLTDATGNFTLEGNIPIGSEFLLVVKAGRFRRAVALTLPEAAACQTYALPATLPENPARLPRDMADGVGVNIPRIAVSTGSVDAIECVLEKMGIADAEFGNPGTGGTAPARVHLYRGNGGMMGMMGTGMGAGARIDDTTPPDTELYSDLARLQSYDMVIADCEGAGYDSRFTQRDADGDKVREYVNRGGRLFGSHLSFTWLHENGATPYDATDPIATGLGPAATWATNIDGQSLVGTGVVSLGRPQASPRIQSFADWMANEGVTTPPASSFEIVEPRSQNATLGASAEEFVYQEDGNQRVQQFSINTPYGAPDDAVCGRVAYSGFHVSVGDASNVIFPEHCAGDLTAQEKVLLYMLFDLSACVGETPPPPECTPQTCEELGAECGFSGDGCGAVLDCGPCKVEPPK